MIGIKHTLMNTLTENKPSLKYSVIVPAYNEQDAVVKLHAEIVQALTKLDQPFEIIFIDDG